MPSYQIVEEIGDTECWLLIFTIFHYNAVPQNKFYFFLFLIKNADIYIYAVITSTNTRTSSRKSKITGVWILYITPKTHRKHVASTSVPYLQK